MAEHVQPKTTRERERPGGDLSHERFLTARERFFAKLRADAEIRRLEALLRKEAPARGD